MVARTSPEAAREVMLQAGLTPLTPYIDAKAPWPCRCTSCGHEYSSTYDRAKQGRGCPKCATIARAIKSAAARRLPTSTVDDVLSKLNLALTGDYKSTHVPITVKCLVCSEEFSGVLRKGKTGYSLSCPRCSAQTKQDSLGPKRVELQDLLEREGAKLVGDEPTSKTSKVSIQCASGHNISTSLIGALSRKKLCHECNPSLGLSSRGIKRVPLDDAKVLQRMTNLGWRLLDKPTAASVEVKVSCLSCGAESRSRLQRLLSSSFVCQCRKDEMRRESVSAKLTPKLMQNKGKLISPMPVRTKDYATFECEKGHQWPATVQSIIFAGTWCPECAGNFMLSLSDIEDLVRARGGTLLSTEYLGVDAHYSFRCNLGHEWDASYSKIKRGQWCPTCGRGSKSEEIARATFEHLFQVPFKKIRPKWLRNSRGRIMEIDGYNDSLKIGFEYQGRQHFEDIGIYGTDIEQRRADDELKFQLCAQNGVRLFYLTFQDSYEDFAKQIKAQAITFGIDVSYIDFDSEIDLASAYVRDDRLAELVKLLEPKNIKVLSTKWLTSAAKYKLECLVCGHKWEATGNHFFNSRKVGGCKLCGYKSTAELNRGGLKDLVDFAAQHGGLCLADSYVQRRWVYTWKCSKGHEFEGNFNNMKFRNEFCPTCENRTVKNPVPADEAIAFFKANNLEPLDPYLGKQRYVRVRCLRCDAESKQSFFNLTNGMAPCKNCEHLRKSKEAEAVMLAAGLKPLEPYLNVTSKWLCECLTCHKQVTPTYINVKRGGGPCIYCGYEKAKKTRWGK